MAHASQIPHAQGSWAMDQTTQQVFSTWQIHLIRDALEGYRMFTPDHESGKSPLSWNALRERITVATDVEFGKDDLRQFVEGKKKGSGKFRIPETARMEALVAFLTDPDIAVLSRDDLENSDFLKTQLPLYLTTFLKTAATPQPVMPPTSLIGTFEGTAEIENGIRTMRLTLGAATGSYLVVNEVDHDFYHTKADASEADSNRSQTPRKTARFIGWAVVTPEDNIIFYMKHAASHENHFWKLVVEEFFWQDEPLQSFYLQRFDWPYEIDTAAMVGDEVKEAYFQLSKPRIVYFERSPERVQ